MTHDAAVRAVVNLVPDIEKRGADVVLRDYALAEDLPPAQLEKLAHVFNTLRTVDHIAQSSDRGSSVDLVDVPSLVIGYATGLGQEKKARTIVTDQTHIPSQVDLMSALRLDVTGARPLKAVTKQAAASVARVSHDELLEAASDLAADARITMSKLAGEILNGLGAYDGTYDLSEIERDALYATGHTAVKRACDWLDKTIHLSRRASVRHDYTAPLVKRAFAAGSELSEKLVELAEAITTYDVMNKLATPYDGNTDDTNSTPDIMIADALGTLSPPPRRTTSRSRVAAAMANMSPDEAAEFASRAHAAGIDLGIEPDDEDNTESESAETETNANNRPSAPQPKDPPSDPAPKGTPEKTNTSKKDSGDFVSLDEKVPPTNPVHAAWGALNSASSAVSKGVSSAATAVDGMLHRITSKERSNSSQRGSDLGVADVRRALSIRRLIGTDDVLRHADPRKVLTVYNSIARMNPEIADNIPAVTLILREAVSYDGITLDSQKTLADIRKSTGDSEAKEHDNDKRRYSVGGSLPIGLVARK